MQKEIQVTYIIWKELMERERELCLVIYCCITNCPKTQWLETETSYYLSQFWRLTGISWMVFCSTCCWRTLQLFGGQTELVCPRWHSHSSSWYCLLAWSSPEAVHWNTSSLLHVASPGLIAGLWDGTFQAHKSGICRSYKAQAWKLYHVISAAFYWSKQVTK